MNRVPITSILLLATMAPLASAQETRIVSPKAYAEIDAPDGWVPAGSGRVQILYEAGDFSDLIGPHWVTEFAFRTDKSVNGETEYDADSVEFRLSTSPKTAADMSLVFADNVGADQAIVFARTGYAGVTRGLGPATGPKEFDMVNQLTTPFLYDPKLGSLLLDFDLHGGRRLPADWIRSPAQSETTKHIAGLLGAANAYLTFGGIVTGFTFRAVGDVDLNGSVDAADIDLLSETIRTGAAARFPFDLNNNGELDEEDRQVWVYDVKSTSFGDANLDGKVDFADFLVLSENFSTAGGWSEGDFDGSGDVAFSDFLLLSNNFGNSEGSVAAVPEPSGAILSLMTTLVFSRCRQRTSFATLRRK